MEQTGSPPIWRRPVTRRSVLAAGATGAAATAVAVLWKGDALSQVLNHLRDTTHGYQGVFASQRVRVAHLLRRAGFGATPAELDRYAAMGVTGATSALLNYQATSNQTLEAALASIDPTTLAGGKGAGTIQAWWLQRMVQTARPLEERMTLFWHGLLTSGLDKVGPAPLFIQNQLFRTMALANFDDLLKAVSKDPAMMLYLDTETNRKGRPNENYARELMELFTTGIGHYTEDDVRESARAFTGWTLNATPKDRRNATASSFVARFHDDGMKTFMGKTGNFTGDDIVEMLVPLRATAERLTTRLFGFFAYPNPEPAIVHHLADVFQQNRYSVRAVVSEIFAMDAFYSEKAYRSLVKSPAEFVAQSLRGLSPSPSGGATIVRVAGFPAWAGQGGGVPQATTAMAPMGQVLFYPPNVAGWPSGSSWINSSTLLSRVNFATALAQKFGSTASLDQLLATFVDGTVSPTTHDTLTQFAHDNPGAAADLLSLTLSTPEFQLN
ncbi:MAG TPA: DUF1800 domain-containing protein [Candidatus Eisenbacteria bacterium]|nr:DUF1800 domain-containing protein [Candidatus Eisenbacteria bacterium]